MVDQESKAQVPSVPLSPRQVQVLRLYCAELQIKEIAAELGLAPLTVASYLVGIRKRAGL